MLTKRVESPKPKVVDGQRQTNKLEYFMWKVKTYFDGMTIMEKVMKVKIASYHLMGIVMLWWCYKHGNMQKVHVSLILRMTSNES